MPNILFWPDINLEAGHWRPVIAMADKVRKLPDFSVKFLCTPECETLIKNCDLSPDFSYSVVLNDLYKVGYSSLVFEKPEEAHSRIEHCLRIASGELDTEINNFQPDLLIAGYFMSLEALLIQYRYNRNKPVEDQMKLIITTTYLRHPNENPYSTSLRFLVHHSQEVSSRLMQEAAPDPDYCSQFDGSFNSIKEFIAPLDYVRELITCPQELDHPEFKHRTNTHYVEPSILDTSSAQIKNPKLIYASAGSRVRDYVEGARSLFRILQNMVNMNSAGTRQLQLAVGYALKEEFFESDNVKIVDWATQTEILKRANSAVVHGGLATIKECIYFGIPPIIVPLGKDQMDNALRVVNKKVGSLMMLDSLTEERLYNAILAAETNLEIKSNIEKMQNKFISDETSPPSIDHIKEELGIS